jgi:DNA polymerase-3 subunit epsilon
MPKRFVPLPTFVAIDFETADYNRHSACAVGLVRVVNGKIVDQASQLLRPPDRWFHFTYLHGMDWDDVADAPTFAQYYPDLKRFIKGADFLAAHNAPFDRSVLDACCEYAGLSVPRAPFVCSMKIAQDELGLYPVNLESVCRSLRIKLNHHDPLSDAWACARIILKASETRAAILIGAGY